MSKVFRTHTFRFGGEYLRQIAQQRPPFNERGSFGFLAGGGFSALANFVDNFSGASGTAARNFGDPVYRPNLDRVSMFFQDTWKTSESLTLSLGLRYENFGQPANNAFGFPALTLDPTQFLVPNKVDRDNNNFGPSVGFAWSPRFKSGILEKMFGEDKTVWRGGYQISYDTFFNNLLSNIAADSPNALSATTTGTTGRGTANFFPTAIRQRLECLLHSTLRLQCSILTSGTRITNGSPSRCSDSCLGDSSLMRPMSVRSAESCL